MPLFGDGHQTIFLNLYTLIEYYTIVFLKNHQTNGHPHLVSTDLSSTKWTIIKFIIETVSTDKVTTGQSHFFTVLLTHMTIDSVY